MIRIRFYHWWIYKLYHWAWNPILRERPEMVNAIVDYMIDWLEAQRDKK